MHNIKFVLELIANFVLFFSAVGCLTPSTQFGPCRISNQIYMSNHINKHCGKVQWYLMHQSDERYSTNKHCG